MTNSSSRTKLFPCFSLFFALTLLKYNHAKWDAGTFDGGMEEAYLDMYAKRGGMDITKMEWNLQRTVIDPKKGPRLDSTCTVRFLDGDGITNGKVALFSTGEVGRWTLTAPEELTAAGAGYSGGPPRGYPSSSNLATPATGSQQQQQLTHTSYDEAVKAYNACIEIEVPSNNKKYDNSLIVYNFPVGSGKIQRLAAVIKAKGSVKYYPDGKTSSSDLLSLGGGLSGGGGGSDASGIEVGRVSMHIKGGKPIVDPSWAKGRRWFWTRREQGGMKHPGYI